MSQGAHAGRLLLAAYREDLKKALSELASSLQPFDDNGLTALLCDVTAPRSAATDTRAERRRFVTNACVYATFVRGIRLGVIDQIELERLLGRELSQYKQELLRLFGRHGYIRHALDSRSEPPASAVALDFVNVHQGFWDLSEASERALFAATTDLILGEPRFRIPDTSHFLVSADNPLNKMIHKIAAPAYQGRSSWPTFNVEFADRMLDYDECSGTDTYRSCARDILRDIRTATETHGGYQELLSEKGSNTAPGPIRAPSPTPGFPVSSPCGSGRSGRRCLDRVVAPEPSRPCEPWDPGRSSCVAGRAAPGTGCANASATQISAQPLCKCTPQKLRTGMSRRGHLASTSTN